MKKITILLLFLNLFFISEAQKVYFIYLQSEKQEPFYTRLGDKVFNSTSTGYLILSKLVDSTYNINIGTQGSQSSEQLFSVTINKKDKGFVIKNFGEKGWGLFDLQSFAVIMPADGNATNSFVLTEKRESNPFTDLLAKAADDSTIKEKPVSIKAIEKKIEIPVHTDQKKEEIQKPNTDSVSIKRVAVNQADIPMLKKEEIQEKTKDSLLVKAEEKKADIPAQVAEKREVKQFEDQVEKKKEELAAATNGGNVNEIRPGIEKKAEEKTETLVIPVTEKKAVKNPFVDEFQKSIVVKRSESSTTEGFGITFLDVAGDGRIDSIRIFIPNEKVKPAVTQVKKDDLKFLDISTIDSTIVKINSDQNIIKEEKNIQPEVTDKSGLKGNNCAQLASDNDFFQLRKNMAAEINKDNMISEAKKIFRSKCFSTEQIKNLSTLFLSDEGKYQFFEASYLYVSDREKFVSLQSELKDEYYINRFKSMLY